MRQLSASEVSILNDIFDEIRCLENNPKVASFSIIHPIDTIIRSREISPVMSKVFLDNLVRLNLIEYVYQTGDDKVLTTVKLMHRPSAVRLTDLGYNLVNSCKAQPYQKNGISKFSDKDLGLSPGIYTVEE